jgi:uncharacterized protein DUF4397
LRVRFGFIALSLCVMAGCGSSSNSSTTGNLRFVQASPDAPLVTVYVNRKLQQANLGYPNATTYFAIHSGDSLQVLPATGSKPILEMKVPINSGANETLIMTGAVANPTSTLLTDGGTTTTTGDGFVRVVNASRNMGTPDVYIVPAGTSISGLAPTVSNIGFNSNTGYVLTPAGAYEVIMTAAGTKNAFLDTQSINLGSGTNQTVVALDAAMNEFSFTMLTDQ